MSKNLWQRNDEWIGTEIEDSFVMVHVTTGKYLSFNRTATLAWSMLETPHTQGDIEQRMMEKFDVAPAVCSQEVAKLLQRMSDLKLVAAV